MEPKVAASVTRRFAIILFAVSAVQLAVGEDGKVDGPVIGIDLGTTYSCVGVFKNGKVEIIPNDQGNRVTPSVMAFVGGDRLVGEAAKNQATVNPAQTVYDVKRFIGRRFEDPIVQSDAKLVPFAIKDQAGKPMVDIEGQAKAMSPEELSAMLLRKLKESAETYLGQKVTHAVITVPAHFNDAQRQATKDAGAIAGLTVLRVLNEPTAAALAYGLSDGHKTVLVYDLGGGTFDVSIVKINPDGQFDVLATAGEAHLGGEDFDQRVMGHLAKTYEKKTGFDMTSNAQAMQRLRLEVEKAKRKLSSIPRVPVIIEGNGDSTMQDLKVELTRAVFDKLNAELFQKTLEPLKRALKDANLKKSDINDVLLVGGSTRIPKVQSLVREFFDDIALSNSVNPDEAVAYGAAIQAGMLSSSTDKGTADMVLNDVTPLSLGLETVGGVMTVVIPRNSVLPAKNKTIFTTHYDNQHGLNLKVCEGERPLTKHNHRLGSVKIRGIEAQPRGKPQIEVTFEVDANGILTVKSEDLTSGNSETTTVKNDKERLSQDQIEAMIKEAEEFAEADKVAKEQVDARVSLEVYLVACQAALNGPDGSEEEKERANVAVSEAREWLKANEEAEVAELQEKRQEVESICGSLVPASITGQASDGEENKEEGGGHDEL